MDVNTLQPHSSERVVRLSLRWVLLAGLAMVAVGALGGMLGSWWNAAPLTALPQTEDRLITTIQEVTISPSTAVAQMVGRSARSVVLLARQEARLAPFGTGVIVTSDGVVATTATLPEGNIVAISNEGEAVAAERVGVDTLYGLQYVRLRGGVFVPADVRDSDVPVGSFLTALGLNPETLHPRVRAYTVQDYVLPAADAFPGWQRLFAGESLGEGMFVGSPLLDDEGRVAALSLRPGGGGATLPSTTLRQSLARVVDRKLEENMFERLGLSLRYIFETTSQDGRQFRIAVTSVRAGTAAASAGVKAGDIIEKVQGEPVAWEKSVVEAFGARDAIALQIRRGEAMLAITIAATTPSP